MADQFLHGVEVLDIDDGARSIQTVSSSVIGIVGTAPRADDATFPLNKPVLVAGSLSLAGKLLANAAGADGDGTLPDALDSIFDQTGAAVVVIRVEKGANDAETLANVIGGVNSVDGSYEGVHAFLGAESALGVKPRILIAPGFTHQRVAGGITLLTIAAPGATYTDGTFDLVFTGGGGTGAAGTATITGGAVTAVAITNPGSGYTTAPTVTLAAGAGAGDGNASITAAFGTTTNAVVAELKGIAERMRAVIIQDGTNTTDADAIAEAGDAGSKRVFLVDPWVLKVDSAGATYAAPPSPCIAGLIARVDNALGWWWSPSNQEIFGIVGTVRPIDFSLGDVNSRANLLNADNVATIVRQNGYRLWGNRTLSPDAKWAFLCVVRTADIIADSLQVNHLWAVDRGITKNYVSDVQEGVNAYLRDLKAIGAILGGHAWVDKDLNSESAISAGHVFWDFDFTPVYPAEHLTFRSHLVNDYIAEIF